MSELRSQLIALLRSARAERGWSFGDLGGIRVPYMTVGNSPPFIMESTK